MEVECECAMVGMWESMINSIMRIQVEVLWQVHLSTKTSQWPGFIVC